MLTGIELTALRTRVLGHEFSGVWQVQLWSLATYKDKTFRPNHDGFPPCANCRVNEPMCELAAERMDPVESERRAVERGRPGESDGTILVKGDLICRGCLAIQLPLLRERLGEVHWIELASDDWQPTAIVITAEAELKAVQRAIARSEI